MGLPPRDIDIFSKLIPSKLGITLKDAYEESQSLREFIQGIFCMSVYLKSQNV